MSDVLDLFNGSKQDVPDIRYVLPGTGEEIFMTPFTTREQKAMLKAIEKEDNVLIQEAMDTILRNCVTNKNFNPDKLLAKDRECLLIELSKNTVTDEINHRWSCEHCGKSNTTSVNLNTLKYIEPHKDAFIFKEVKFDGFDFEVRLSNLNRLDEKKIIALGMKEGGEEISQASVILSTIASLIKQYKKITIKEVKNAEGVLEKVENFVWEDIKFDDRLKIYEKLGLSDKKKIDNFLTDIKEYGYDVNLGEQTCKHCSKSSDVSLEWMDFFIV